MKILFLTNFYPPFELGGQGRSCEQVVKGLITRGHQVQVLTSMHGVKNGPIRMGHIHRALHLEMDFKPLQNAITFFTHRKRREFENLRELEDRISEFSPDVIFIWGMWNLPRSLAVRAEALCPDCVLYRFAEYWPTLPGQHVLYWQTEGRHALMGLSKKLMRKIAFRILEREGPPESLQFRHVMCVSAATRQELLNHGVPVRDAEIIYTGLDPQVFSEPGRRTPTVNQLRLLYVGRLTEEKGIRTAIQARHQLKRNRPQLNCHLNIVGAGSGVFLRSLNEEIARLNLVNEITFSGRVPPERMPQIYSEHDVLLVPSIWPEPFARVVLEGMAAGLIVIASRAGGSKEAIEDGVNGLLFEPGDAGELVEKIGMAASDVEYRLKMASAAQDTVLQRFTTTRMLDQIEAFLYRVAGCTSAPATATVKSTAPTGHP